MTGVRLNFTVSYLTASAAGAVTTLAQDHGGEDGNEIYNMQSIAL